MPLPNPTIDELTNRIYLRICNETGLNVPISASNMGRIAKIIAIEIKNIWDSVNQEFAQSDLTTATGASLDSIGSLFNVIRQQNQPATSLGGSRSVRFSNVGSSSILLNAGIRVWKDSSPQIAYLTTEGSTVAPGSYVNVHVVAANPGDVYNVTIGELTRHNYPSTSILVTNILPITNGANEESDASYRERILQGIRSIKSPTINSLVALARQVPGVQDVIAFNKKRGPGSFDLVVIPYTQNTVAQVVSEVNSLISDYVLAGQDAYVTGPNYRFLDLNINLRFSPTVGTRQEQIRDTLRQQIQSYIDSLSLELGGNVGSLWVPKIKSFATSDVDVLDASIGVGLDGVPYSPNGEVRIGIGDKIALRTLNVQ